MEIARTPMSVEERNRLRDALRGNAEQGTPLYQQARTTRFTPDMELTEEEVINAIRSVPTHY